MFYFTIPPMRTVMEKPQKCECSGVLHSFTLLFCAYLPNSMRLLLFSFRSFQSTLFYVSDIHKTLLHPVLFKADHKIICIYNQPTHYIPLILAVCIPWITIPVHRHVYIRNHWWADQALCRDKCYNKLTPIDAVLLNIPKEITRHNNLPRILCT